MLFGRSSSVSYHLSAETHQERIMIASTELDEEVFRGRAEENPESARSVIYAIFSAHSAYFNVSRREVLHPLSPLGTQAARVHTKKS